MDEGRRREIVLTPVITSSKIPILVLIKHYCYKKLPQRCIPPILSILVELIGKEQTTHLGANSDIVQLYFPSLLEMLQSIEASIRSFFKTSAGGNIDQVEKDIKFICHSLLHDLWELGSYDDFFSFLISSSLLLIDPSDELKSPLSKSSGILRPSKTIFSSSFLGSFISVLSLGAMTMSFEEGLNLWKGFAEYRKESESFWQSASGIPNGSPTNTEAYVFETDILPKAQLFDDNAKTVVYSHMDLSSLFQSQVSILQKKSTPISKSLEDLLKSLSQSDRSLIPSSYHVEYLNSWRQADYDESFDALHRYFDYMMSNRRQYFYHYALLALASLHSSFGANKEALRAIDEAILVARENKDLDCLNYLLTWLLNFMITKPHLFINSKDHPSRSEITNFLRLKTKETKNSSLQAIAFQFEVVISLLEGQPLSSVVENMVKTLYLVLNFEDTDELKGMFITVCQIEDSLWKRIGYPSIGNLYLDAAIDFAKEKSNEFDLIILYIRKATDLFFTGEIDETFKLLLSVEKAAIKDFSMSKKWKMAYSILKFYFYLNKCKFSQCSVLIQQMSSLPANVDDQEVTNELIYQRALYHMSINNINESFKIITDQLTSMKENTIVYNNFWFIRLQVLYCQVYVNHTQYPERGLSILLNAINLSHKSSLTFNLCECIICLCNLLLKSDPQSSIQNVYDLIEEFLPKILEIGRLDMISDAYYILAYVEFEKFQNNRDTSTFGEGNKSTCSILKHLNIAIRGYETMYDYLKIKQALEFEQKIATYCKRSELVSEIVAKLANLELSIKNENSSPL